MNEIDRMLEESWRDYDERQTREALREESEWSLARLNAQMFEEARQVAGVSAETAQEDDSVKQRYLKFAQDFARLGKAAAVGPTDALASILKIVPEATGDEDLRVKIEEIIGSGFEAETNRK